MLEYGHFVTSSFDYARCSSVTFIWNRAFKQTISTL